MGQVITTKYWISRPIITSTNTTDDVGYMVWPGDAELVVKPDGEMFYWYATNDGTTRLYSQRRVWELTHPELILQPGEARLALLERVVGKWYRWRWVDKGPRYE